MKDDPRPSATRSASHSSRRAPKIISILIIMILAAAVLNHVYQWYPWPWGTAAHPLKARPVSQTAAATGQLPGGSADQITDQSGETSAVAKAEAPVVFDFNTLNKDKKEAEPVESVQVPESQAVKQAAKGAEQPQAKAQGSDPEVNLLALNRGDKIVEQDLVEETPPPVVPKATAKKRTISKSKPAEPKKQTFKIAVVTGKAAIAKESNPVTKRQQKIVPTAMKSKPAEPKKQTFKIAAVTGKAAIAKESNPVTKRQQKIVPTAMKSKPEKIPQQKITPTATKPAPSVVVPQPPAKNNNAKQLLKKRKRRFGVKRSIDLVVKPGEFIRIGDEKLPLDQILAKIGLVGLNAAGAGNNNGQGDSARRAKNTAAGLNLSSRSLSGLLLAAEGWVENGGVNAGNEPANYYGIYVVRPGDNLWDIHFNFLREFFGSRGVVVADDSDEPLPNKQSSGIGRILKYAENMVFIFNLKTQRLSHNLNLLGPHEKIIVFNLSHLNRILGPLTATEINRVHYFEPGDLVIR